MLIDKGVTIGEVVTLKLTSGEELVAKLEEETATYYKLSRPMVIGMGQKGPGLMPYLFTVDPKKPNFKPFDSLSEEEVISWTQASLGANQVSAIYTSIDTKIKDQIAPAIITVQGPWNNSESV